jgi:dTDP-4-amino-4,6-dideoxygalactose transaminase
MATFHYVPLHSSPFWQRYAGGSPSLPVTDRVAAALVRLPLHPRLTEEDLDRVVSAVEEAPV